MIADFRFVAYFRNILKPVLAASLALLLAGCGDTDQLNVVGAIERVAGGAFVTHAGKEAPATVGMVLYADAVIRTEADGVVVAKLKHGRAEIELQANAEFHLKEFEDNSAELHLRKGNLWARVNKLTPNERFNVRTPTAIAAVRGTKFYTFHIQDAQGRDLHGTCHCDGDVHYDAHHGGYEDLHSGDFVTLTRGEKTILFKPEELSFLGESGWTHTHSSLDDSPLGPRDEALTPEQMAAFIAAAEKKFAAL